MNMELSLTPGDTAVKEDVDAARKGDKAAFIKLLETSKVTMYNVASRMLSDKHDIEDALQETVANAWKGIRKLKSDEFFKTWLIRILINECLPPKESSNNCMKGVNLKNHICYFLNQRVYIL